MKCEKRKVYSRIFCVTFLHFVPFFTLFAFHSILHQGRHSREKSKNFAVYFFAALIKHEIHMKYEKSTAGLRPAIQFSWNSMIACKIRKVYSRVFHSTFLALHIIFFAFRTILRFAKFPTGQHSRKTSKAGYKLIVFRISQIFHECFHETYHKIWNTDYTPFVFHSNLICTKK